MTHSLPRHGRFLYLTENLIKSKYSAQQSHPKSDAKNKDIINTWLKLERKNLHFHNMLVKSLILRKKILWFMNSSGSEVFKTVFDVVFIMSG